MSELQSTYRINRDNDETPSAPAPLPPPTRPDLDAIQRRIDLVNIAPDDVEFTRYELESVDLPALLAWADHLERRVAALEAAGKAVIQDAGRLAIGGELVTIVGTPAFEALKATLAVGRRAGEGGE